MALSCMISEIKQDIGRQQTSVSVQNFSQILRKIMVHPKDKVPREEVSECVYKIPCKNCDKVCIGEMGRPFVTKLNEHKKEVEQKDKTKFTRQRKQSVDEQQNKSAITNHVVKKITS